MSIKTRKLMEQANAAATNQEIKDVEDAIKRHYKRYGRISNWGEARWGEAVIRPVCVRHHEMRFVAYQ